MMTGVYFLGIMVYITLNTILILKELEKIKKQNADISRYIVGRLLDKEGE